uniref:SoxL4AB n=1 Tax=Leucosolenia complicata TaxID=433461 RepID=I7CDX2_9METZ|nr:SoxL4AB [Leucosolenia complicata]
MCLLGSPETRPAQGCAPQPTGFIHWQPGFLSPLNLTQLSTSQGTVDSDLKPAPREDVDMKPTQGQQMAGCWSSGILPSVNQEPASAAPIPSPAPAPGHTKRPMNAFLLWTKEHRKHVSDSNPDMCNADVSTTLGRMWRSLPMGDKQPYLKMAEGIRHKHRTDNPGYYRHCPRTRPRTKDKSVLDKIQSMIAQLDIQEYVGECPIRGNPAHTSTQAAHKADDSISQQHDSLAMEDNATQPRSSSETEREPTRGLEAKTPRSKRSRPINCFLLWSKWARPKLAKRFPDSPNWEISMLLGEVWKLLPKKDKGQYHKNAEILRQEHRQSHPDLYKQRHSRRERNAAAEQDKSGTVAGIKQESEGSDRTQSSPGTADQLGEILSSSSFTASPTSLLGNISSPFSDSITPHSSSHPFSYSANSTEFLNLGNEPFAGLSPVDVDACLASIPVGDLQTTYSMPSNQASATSTGWLDVANTYDGNGRVAEVASNLQAAAQLCTRPGQSLQSPQNLLPARSSLPFPDVGAFTSNGTSLTSLLNNPIAMTQHAYPYPGALQGNSYVDQHALIATSSLPPSFLHSLPG